MPGQSGAVHKRRGCKEVRGRIELDKDSILVRASPVCRRQTFCVQFSSITVRFVTPMGFNTKRY
jgi:hypothetical protein